MGIWMATRSIDHGRISIPQTTLDVRGGTVPENVAFELESAFKATPECRLISI